MRRKDRQSAARRLIIEYLTTVHPGWCYSNEIDEIRLAHDIRPHDLTMALSETCYTVALAVPKQGMAYVLNHVKIPPEHLLGYKPKIIIDELSKEYIAIRAELKRQFMLSPDRTIRTPTTNSDLILYTLDRISYEVGKTHRRLKSAVEAE